MMTKTIEKKDYLRNKICKGQKEDKSCPKFDVNSGKECPDDWNGDPGMDWKTNMMWENVDMYGDFRPFKCWWLYEEGDGFTENNMMRSPFSGRYFKLAYDPTDYYGVDQVDVHSHGA